MGQGQDCIAIYMAPILYQVPAYQSQFCSRCGSPVPDSLPNGEFLEIPAGLLDDDPGRVPDKHIFVEFLPEWDQITDALPQFTIADLIRERHGAELPSTFVLRSHYDGGEVVPDKSIKLKE
ncbi:MAG: hypothetical protein ACJAX5_002225 [Patiriisocius sp.]